MTRRTLFKTLLAAPLAALCFWRKPKRHVITADDAFALAKRIHEDDDSLSGNYDMIRGVPPPMRYWLGPEEIKTLHVKERRKNWRIDIS